MAIRDQHVRGTSDDKLWKDAQANEYMLEELIMRGQSYKQSRINSKPMASKPEARLEKREMPSQVFRGWKGGGKSRGWAGG